MTPRKLAVFDVDGTLLRSFELDGECYFAAFEDALGINDIDTDWARYDHVTDPGIAAQIIRERLGRKAFADELARLQQAFLGRLVRAAERDGAYAALPGADALIARLRDGGDWCVALATGGWCDAALFKIGCSGLDIDGLPAAFGEDGPSRQAIVRAAIARARENAGGADFARIVCIGDGIWDVRTANSLGYPCIGVAAGEHAARLAAEGASHVVADFRDPEAFLKALEDAALPVRG